MEAEALFACEFPMSNFISKGSGWRDDILGRVQRRAISSGCRPVRALIGMGGRMYY